MYCIINLSNAYVVNIMYAENRVYYYKERGLIYEEPQPEALYRSSVRSCNDGYSSAFRVICKL